MTYLVDRRKDVKKVILDVHTFFFYVIIKRYALNYPLIKGRELYENDCEPR